MTQRDDTIPNHDVTGLLRDAAAGDAAARDKLFPLVYEALHARAKALMRQERPDHTLQATILVDDALIKLVGRPDVHFNDRVHFLAVAARAMRRILVDHAIAKKTEKRGGGWGRIPLTKAEGLLIRDDVDLRDLDEAIKVLEVIHPREASVVEYRLFGGMKDDEIARVVGISDRQVQRDWKFGRNWLYCRLIESDA